MTISHPCRIPVDSLLYWYDFFSTERLAAAGLRSVPYLIGPVDLVPIVRMRQELSKMDIDLLRLSVSDVLLLGEGETSLASSSKIGGLPYRERDRPWPSDDEGEDYEFLCQFNFSDSRDLVGATPEEVLMIFTKEGLPLAPGNEEQQLYCEWGPSRLSEPLRTTKAGWRNRSVVQCFGASIRLTEYSPFPVDAVADIFGRWNMETSVDEAKGWAHFGAQPLGMKIGGLPICMDREDVVARNLSRYLCSLTTVYPKFNSPFPWINQEAANTNGERSVVGSSLFLGDNLELNVFLDDSGSAQCFMASIASAQR